jgi:hypothetical protein
VDRWSGIENLIGDRATARPLNALPPETQKIIIDIANDVTSSSGKTAYSQADLALQKNKGKILTDYYVEYRIP